MKISDITNYLQTLAPLSIQEKYDNAGLLTGDENWECTGIITTLDTTEEVVNEAIEKGCNLIVAHHPIIFSGLKKITGRNYVEKTIIKAISNKIALYAIHTNLDNIKTGVNGRIAEKLGVLLFLLPVGDTSQITVNVVSMLKEQVLSSLEMLLTHLSANLVSGILKKR